MNVYVGTLNYFFKTSAGAEPDEPVPVFRVLLEISGAFANVARDSGNVIEIKPKEKIVLNPQGFQTAIFQLIDHHDIGEEVINRVLCDALAKRAEYDYQEGIDPTTGQPPKWGKHKPKFRPHEITARYTLEHQGGV